MAELYGFTQVSFETSFLDLVLKFPMHSAGLPRPFALPPASVFMCPTEDLEDLISSDSFYKVPYLDFIPWSRCTVIGMSPSDKLHCLDVHLTSSTEPTIPNDFFSQGHEFCLCALDMLLEERLCMSLRRLTFVHDHHYCVGDTLRGAVSICLPFPVKAVIVVGKDGSLCNGELGIVYKGKVGIGESQGHGELDLGKK